MFVGVTMAHTIATYRDYPRRLLEAAAALNRNALHVAEPLLRQHLKEDPFDVFAIRMFAELAGRIGRFRDAENLLRRALELAPAFTAARSNLALVLYRLNRPEEAIAELEQVSIEEPESPVHTNLKAAVLNRIGDLNAAIELYDQILARNGGQPRIWLSYGHTLRSVGRTDDCIAAYRRAIALRPVLGEAWWSIANIKTARLEATDIGAMEGALADSAVEGEDRFHLHFALAKAHDDAKRPEAAFAHYAEANRLRRAALPYEAADTTAAVDAAIATYSSDLFARHQEQGCDAPDPVFIVGLPRAGSTLIEQILSSHSQVEGTMELPDIPGLVNTLGHEGRYPAIVNGLDPRRLREMGETYMARTRIQRREGKPLFIDKLPNNWLFTGLIHLILPNARIIDARRHPLDCGYSNFRQHFARGQAFSYDLADIGAYYADYVRFMAHIDAVLPGRVVRVIHEDLLDDPEAEIRRLLAALGLPFEQACLEFSSNKRAVRTPSNEQVRRPVNRSGEGQWRPVEPHLGPLITALGPVLGAYPGVPDF